MTAPAIEIENLQFAWPGRAPLLRIESLRILRGERVFLKGPSGSGKSTLLGLIGGVLTPNSGVVRLIGTSLGELGAGSRDEFRGNHVGFIFQMFNLIPYLSVRANALLPFKFSPERRKKVAPEEREKEVLRLLSALGLSGTELMHRPVTDLSIGQQQRVAAVRALIGRPDILVADEPTSALDTETREEFLQLLMRESSACGATLLFVSHDPTLAAQFDRVLSMRDFIPPAIDDSSRGTR
jgi:putative ABC transport system ATP-binding protein